MPLTAARKNPYDPGDGTQNLSGASYYTWTDLDGDGRLDTHEGSEHLMVTADTATQQNFANWYTYYRLRHYTAKAAFGRVIASANDMRMGLMTIHNDNDPRTPLTSLNPDPASGTKGALLDALYRINTHSNTPLRQALLTAGQYIECVPGNGISTTCPVLSESDGGACQQHYALMISDGFYNQSIAPLGNTDGPSPGNTLWDGGAYADDRSHTLADVAMHFYERDLHPDLPNQVPILPGVDNATHQHMVSYMVAFGLIGSLNGPPSDPGTPFAWPPPSGNGRVDDMLHAAYNSRGEFFSAFNANELSAALAQALERVTSGTGSAASVAINSGSLQSDSHVYQIRYHTAGWSGEVAAYSINTNGSVAANPTWQAAEQLNTQPYDSGRHILTSHATSRQGIPFRWNTLAPSQQTALHTALNGTHDHEGEARLNYLRGSREHEGNLNDYRPRQHLLGDIVHSTPEYVGKPPFPDAVGDSYASFRSTYSSRTPMLYVGANDGMLHGFNALTGSEVLAYVPTSVFPHLSHLTNRAYTHRYYVDAAPTVLDAYGSFGSRCTSSPCWRSVLVSGLGGGGQGVFALDVTNPDHFAESDASKLVLWEFTDADDADLGYTYGQPSIVHMANDKWAAVFGNGYNNTATDDHISSTGHAVLYIVFLDRGTDGAWTIGSDYIKLDTGVGEPEQPNGLAAPAPADVSGNFSTEFIYAGDLRGNVWKFDVSSSSPANWGVASNTPLFTATSAGGTPQPITSRPEVGDHYQDPTSVLVYVGTGQYLQPSDHTVVGVPTQTVYAVWDPNTGAHTTSQRSDLLAQHVIVQAADYRVSSAETIDWTQHQGWYIDLPSAGERHVSRPVLRSDRIVFTTLIPSSDPCAPGNSGWLMELDRHSGSRLTESPFDRNGDQQFTQQDFVTITIDGQTEEVPVSGLISPHGALSLPAVLNMGTTELKLSSSSSGALVTIVENPGREARGRQAWRSLP